ncbi:MAG: hypothetical protein FWF86_05065 [Clostridia bacterium]|nr:hypothetical protein [Clostridia bacterium]
MRHTFEHLLGLTTEAALALLTAEGIFHVQVVPTLAPPRRNPGLQDGLRSDAGEAKGYASTRVVAVQEDGRRLIVSRFLTNEPFLREEGPVDHKPASGHTPVSTTP